MDYKDFENVDIEALNSFIWRNHRMAGDSGPVKNFRIVKEKLYGTTEDIADYLYDWVALYLEDKKYREAEVCLLEIEKMNCWDEDETLKPGTYSFFASCYFNMAVKKHVGRKYKAIEFEKARKCAEIACEYKTKDNFFNERTLTGAWQVLFAIAVLTGDYLGAARIKAETNIKFLAERAKNFYDVNNNWYVGNEIGDTELETEFYRIVQKNIFEHPEKFDQLYELHVSHKASYNYTEPLTFLSTLVENNTVRTALLYNDLFEYISLKNTNYENYFMLCSGKLSSVVFTNDKGEIRRTIKQLDALKEEHPEDFEKVNFFTRQEYYGGKLHALVQLGEYDEVLRFANTISQEDYTEEVLYCVAKAKEQMGDFENAERVAAAALSIETDVFKVTGLGRLYYSERKYEDAYQMQSWALEGIEKELKAGVKVQVPRYMPFLKRPTVSIYKEICEEAIDTLLMLNRFSDARALLEKYEKIPSATEKHKIQIKIDHTEELYTSQKQFETERDNIREELNKKDETIQEMVELQKNWYQDLLKCQILDTDAVLTDDEWEELNSNSKIDLVINKIKEFIPAYGREMYDDIMVKVKERYPNLSEQAQRYLASAEQIFAVFKQNPVIDCAPALVEFARVFEESLWNFIDNTGYYSAAAKESLKNHTKALGTAGYIISNNDGPLKAYGKTVRDIAFMRNNSAHAYVSKEPEIASIRKLIWEEKPSLLDVLCEVK